VLAAAGLHLAWAWVPSSFLAGLLSCWGTLAAAPAGCLLRGDWGGGGLLAALLLVVALVAGASPAYALLPLSVSERLPWQLGSGGSAGQPGNTAGHAVQRSAPHPA
jgi:hypothetical protein